MKIRALRPRVTIFGPFVPRRIYDVRPEVAQEWIRLGYAEPVEEIAKTEESADALAPSEQKRASRKRRRGKGIPGSA